MTYKIALLCKYSTVPRTLRMAKILANAGYIVHIIEWDRMGLKPKIEIKNGIVFKRLSLKSDYGLRSFYLIPVWTIFAFIQIMIGNYHIIQPQNLDCMVPTFFSTRLVKSARVIYDLADFYRDAYVTGVPIVSLISGLLEKLLIRRADALILVSERQVLQVEARNLPEKVMLFYNTPDVNFRISIDDSRFINKENGTMFTLFYPGELNYDKVKLLMNVIEAVKGLPVKIVIAGFGKYGGLLRRLSEANKQLIFLGYLDHQEVMGLYKRADLILLPYDPSYINNRIGLPNKLFEAMACGSLILAPHNTYMGEIVEREKIGKVVDFSNATEIRRALESVIRSEMNAIQLFKQNARRLYIEKFNPQKINTKYLRIVESLVSK